METQTKTCQNCKNDFTIEPDDFSFYEKMKVPAPTFCPSCRFQRRISFRNERILFRVKDAFTNEEIFSLYPAESNRKVISQEEWYGDKWDAMEYGRDYDFSKPFLQQILELEKEVPIFNRNVEFMVNSPYSGNATGLKNCYLCFTSNYSEDCMYCSGADYCKDCVDDCHINHSERCYESFWLENCYQCYYSIICKESRNLYFCKNCLGCNDCFGCVDLRKSSYCIYNKQYTKEEYQNKIKEMKLNTISGIKEGRNLARNFWKTWPTKYHQGLNNLNSTGSYVTNSKNVNDSYLIRDGENMRYCQYLSVPKNKECYDVTVWGSGTELSYETCVSGENSYNLKFCFNCWPACRESEYCMNIFSSSDCFGCVGVKKKQYCILNKQYTKDEYLKMVEKIKKHMDEMPFIDKQGLIYKYGEFFPIEFSPFGYNNSIVFQHFPLTEKEAKEKGYEWINVPRGNFTISKKSHELPEYIEEVTENIIKEIIECEECKKPYKITENELTFLKKEIIPLPTECNDCRYMRRIADRLKSTLFKRKCMCKGQKDETGRYKNNSLHTHGNNQCEEIFKTGYDPKSDEIVYCEKCYQQEVY